ncbi:unnamed protein product, partial [Polarella glacialis]
VHIVCTFPVDVGMLDSGHGSAYRPDSAMRTCTNPCWALWFVMMLGHLVYAYVYAVQHGDLAKLSGLPNGQGLVCGVDAEVANLPYLYLCPDESNRGGETHAAVGLEDLVCVSKCPV